MKTKLTLLFAVSLCAIPLASQADNLKITNNTTIPSTCIINGGGCSTMLGDIGTTQPNGATNEIPETTVAKVCGKNHQTDCTADVYLSTNCNASGAQPIATVVFDTKKGIQSVTSLNSNYSVLGSGFSITLNPA